MHNKDMVPTTIGKGAILALSALVYMVLLGGTNVAELSPLFAALSACIAVPFVVVYFRDAPRLADGADRLVLLAVVLFASAGVLSLLPRQAFEPVLACVAYAAGLFVARRHFRRPATRRALVWTLMLLSAVITGLTVFRWGFYVTDWMTLADWRSTPPLNMDLPSIPWGHRHDLALLTVMLYPAWWMNDPTRMRRVAGIVVGVGVVFVVIIDGSRMLWLSIASATLLTLAIPIVMRERRLAISRTAMGMSLVIGAVAVVGIVVSGVGAGLLARIGDLESVSWRTAMWSALIQSWIAHPLAGSGPGSFPWILQTTGYFDTSSFAPRHPDSAVFQVLAEAGILGLGAMLAVIAAILPGLVRRTSRGALWALATFAIVSLGSNPTDFAFIVVVAIAWASVLMPSVELAQRHVAPATIQEHRWRPTSAVALAVGVAVALAWGATAVGSFYYSSAREAVAVRDLQRASDDLDLASTFDPSMALYARQRGMVSYLLGDFELAVSQLRGATSMNPIDDLAWRSLALASLAAGDPSSANAELNAAVDAQRSDPTNLLLEIGWLAEHHQSQQAFDMAAETVQAWPHIIYSRGWEALLAETPFDTVSVVGAAGARWDEELPRPELIEDQGIWLSVLNGAPTAPARAVAQSDYSTSLAMAASRLLRCEPATDLLDDPTPQDLQSAIYWRLRIRNGAVVGVTDDRATRMVELMTRRRLPAEDETLNAFRENSVRGTSADVWGYRRPPIDWPRLAFELPSPASGMAAWLAGDDCDR